MHSSISSSNQRLPSLAWRPILLGAVLMLIAFVAAMELRLAAKGFHPTVTDSEALWQTERARARSLGKRALIIVGASRIQLGLNLEVLRRLTGLEPVQLALDGTNPLSVFEGLARDSNIRGVVLVDYYDFMLAGGTDYSHNYEKRFESLPINYSFPDYAKIESYLSQRWRWMLRSYADGAKPLTTLLIRIFSNATPQYLVTLPNRSRLADYQQVEMPDMYYNRVIRILGGTFERPAQATHTELQRFIESQILKVEPHDDKIFMSQPRLEYLESLIQMIRNRGGQVVFVVMPTSGMARDIERRRYPRSRFWDRLAAQISARTIHFEDFPALRDFVCPDGSHLDYRDQVRFTTALVAAASLERR